MNERSFRQLQLSAVKKNLFSEKKEFIVSQLANSRQSLFASGFHFDSY
jgi:hypothetical protein